MPCTTIMAKNTTTEFVPSSIRNKRRNRRRLVLCDVVVFGIVAVAVVLKNSRTTDAFLLPNQLKNPSTYTTGQRRSLFMSTKSTNTTTAIPFFTNPKESRASTEFVRDNVESISNDIDDDGTDASVFPSLLKLASMHCASQALNTAVKLKIPDILDNDKLSVQEVARAIEARFAENSGADEDEELPLPCNRDALFRTLRLLTTIDVIKEELASDQESVSLSASATEASFRFSLTPLGRSLRTPSEEDKPSMASCVLHWMEEPLWDSWLELPDYIAEGGVEDKNDTLLPFERANGAVSSDEYYNQDDNPESLKNANEFVRLIHNHELEAVVTGFDWSIYGGHRLVDVAGNNGKLAEAITDHEPSLDCSCLDLKSVIDAIPEGQEPQNVKLIPGNVLDPNTIPDCEVLLMKHFCDRCMWFDDQTVEILRSCKTVLERSGENEIAPAVRRRIVIADAVLPDCGKASSQNKNELPLYLDAMYMLVGRERQRTRSEWKALAEASGLKLAGVVDTGVPSCSLIVLELWPKLSP